MEMSGIEESPAKRAVFTQPASSSLTSSSSSSSSPSLSNKAEKKLLVTRVGDYSLLESLRLLTRWELDHLPLVSRQFRRVLGIDGSSGTSSRTTLLQQRRMIEECLWGFTRTVTIRVAKPLVKDNEKRHLVFKCRYGLSIGTLNFSPTWDYYISQEEFAELVSKSPLLRARRTTIAQYQGAYLSGVEAAKFSSIWEGCHLVLSLPRYQRYLDGFPPLLDETRRVVEFRPPGGGDSPIGACSSLCVEADKLCDVHYAGGLTAMLECKEVVFQCPCSGISFEQIVDFLFASAVDGQKRKLAVNLRFPPSNANKYTSMRLKQLLEELELMDVGKLRGQFELLPITMPGFAATSHHTLKTETKLMLPPVKCTFVASSLLVGGGLSGTSAHDGPDTFIKVECSRPQRSPNADGKREVDKKKENLNKEKEDEEEEEGSEESNGYAAVEYAKLTRRLGLDQDSWRKESIRHLLPSYTPYKQWRNHNCD